MRQKIKREGEFWVYIVECDDGAYYTGYANDLEERLKEHNNSCSRRAKYLRGRLPVRLVWCKEYRYYRNAVHAERNIKQLSHSQKQKLVKIYEKADC